MIIDVIFKKIIGISFIFVGMEDPIFKKYKEEVTPKLLVEDYSIWGVELTAVCFFYFL